MPANTDETLEQPPGDLIPSGGRRSGRPSSAEGRFTPGTVLVQRYRIVSLLGKGGLGEVYRADDLKLEQPVALKFLSQELEGNESLLRRLFEEIKVARQISHANICRVYDLGEAQGVHFLSMEYIDGEDLSSLLRRIGRLPWDKAVEIGQQMCAGLAAAHLAGIVHRDLKPANVMIDGDGRARITDFGLAALSESVRGAEIRSGTPAYMAPEQLRGHEVTFSSDIFALGLVLYELFTGQRAFEASSRDEFETLYREGKVSAPSSLVEGFDPGVERAILACLAIEPEDRPASATAVADALAAGLGAAEGARIATLLLSDLVGSSALVERTGDAASAELFQQHDRLARDLLDKHDGREIDKTDGFLLLFDRPWQAVLYALDYHRALAELSQTAGVELASRVGIHLGEIVLRRNPAEDVARGAKPLEVEGLAKPTAARLMSVAGGRQTLMTQAAFDLARRSAVGSTRNVGVLQWLAHGSYLFKGVEEPVEVFEVGVAGTAPLAAPASSEKVTRVDDEDTILGWRPAPGLEIPHRTDWVVRDKLGEGGFGEVWLGEQKKTGEERVYKFCYEAERLRSLQREITVFRLLKEELGLRDDIARVLGWNLDEAPYFIEFVYIEGGSLVDWAAARGGIAELPLGQRLELAGQVATALAAAHSVGVLHKDVKPGNVLIESDSEGRPRAVLTDFGIGLVTDHARLADKGITMLGMTEMEISTGGSAATGTQLYMAPELLAGQPSTIQADIFAFGVMLYQLVVGDLERPLAQGWERHVEDQLLREDIAALIDGSPARRPGSATEVAERLRTLEQRRAARAAKEQAARAAERAQRRRKLLTTVAAVSTVFLVVVSLLAIQALRARADAERRRAQAEQLIDFMLNDLHEGLEKIGRLDLLDSVARSSREHLDSLGERDETPEATYQRGITLLNIGDVLLHQGDADTALATYRSALALFANAANRQPGAAPWQVGRFESHLRIGGVLKEQGKTGEAFEALRTALAETEEPAGGRPAAPDRGFAVARARFALAELERLRGNVEAAVDECRAIIELGRRLEAPAGTLDWRYARLLVDAHIQLGQLLRFQDDHDAALDANREAMRLVESNASSDPANVVWREQLATIQWEIGFNLWLKGDLADALRSAEEALHVRQGLAATDPTRVERRLDVAKSLRLVGLIHDDADRPRAALANLRQSLDIFERLAAEDPSRLQWLRRGARIHQSIASIQHNSGDLSGALESYLVAHELRQRLADAAGNDVAPRNELAFNHVLMGDVHAARGEREAARAEWLRALEIIEPITAASDELMYLDTEAQALLKLGRYDEARPVVEDLLERKWDDPDFLELVRRSRLADLLR